MKPATGQTEKFFSALGKPCAVVAALTDRDVESLNRLHLSAADMIELRIDLFRDTSVSSVLDTVKKARSKFGKPLIATVRDPSEGGKNVVSDRFSLYDVVLPYVEMVDAEIRHGGIVSRILSARADGGTVVIGSYHDFSGMPSDSVLEDVHGMGIGLGADIIKIAVTAVDDEDVLRLLLFTRRHRDHGIATMAMGKTGRISRVLSPLFGSCLTYGYITEPTAPGQMPVAGLRLFLDSFGFKGGKPFGIPGD